MTARIERHRVSDKTLEEATADFFDEISIRVRGEQQSGRSGFGWEMIADSLLDYAGARSVAVPQVDADIAVAVYSAAEARIGALKLDGAPTSAEFSVDLTYTRTGVYYQDHDEEQWEESRGQTEVRPSDWSEALYLCIVADLHESNRGALVNFAADFDDGEVLQRLLAYYVFPGLGVEREQLVGYAESAIAPFVVSFGKEQKHPDFDSVSSDLLFLHALLDRNEELFWTLMAFRLEWFRDRNEGGPARGLLPVPELAFAALAVRVEGWEMPFESDYLPRRLVEGEHRYDRARVGPYGADKDAAALRELAGGPLLVERPTGTFSSDRDAAVTFRYQDRDLAEIGELGDHPKHLLRELQQNARWELAGFRLYSVADPTGGHPRQIAALNHASQYTAAAFACVAGESGGTAEVTIGEATVALPCVERTREISEFARVTAIEYALVSGSRERLDTLVAYPQEAFLSEREGYGSSVFVRYGSALLAFLKAERARGWRRWPEEEPRPRHGAVRAAVDEALAALSVHDSLESPPPPVVLLSQLVAGDREGFDLALADALEKHRDTCGVADGLKDSDNLVNRNILALACLARARGWQARVRSGYLPEGALDRAATMFG